MDEYFDDGKTMECEDYSWSNLTTWPDIKEARALQTKALQINNNSITVLPRAISMFVNLVCLDLSNNAMSYISDNIIQLRYLKTLTARNNLFDQECLPKDLGLMNSLEVINFNGNRFTEFPMQFTELSGLKCLYLGSNQIQSLPRDIKNMISLQILHLGGNRLIEVPDEIGCLGQLTALNMCDNVLQSLPTTILCLQRLKSLMLHNNQLSVLPPAIVGLDLVELSLRNNPLVMKFVRDMVYNVPSLLELAGRTIKTNNIQYYHGEIPDNLLHYLSTAHSCVNPRCKGVYFSSRWEHIKFVDFCGKYRVPLLQYLCSPGCTPAQPSIRCNSESDSEEDIPIKKMKKVLLG